MVVFFACIFPFLSFLVFAPLSLFQEFGVGVVADERRKQRRKTAKNWGRGGRNSSATAVIFLPLFCDFCFESHTVPAPFPGVGGFEGYCSLFRCR